METIEVLNSRLIDYYGIDTNTGRPMYRIVWADDQFEKRLTTYLDSGIELLHPIVREMPKYPYLRHLYVLERLVIIPDINKDELPTQKLSYEPIWGYRSDKGEAILPAWIPTKFIIDTLYAALGKSSLRKYVDSKENTTVEGMDLRITKLCDELFGNETEVTDALAYKEGIVVPENFKKES